MDDNTNSMEQGAVESSAPQDNFIQGIQGMITGLIKSEIDKMQKSETDKQLGNAAPNTPDLSGIDSLPPAMDITDIKEIVSSVQRFLDNVNMMIAHLEGGNTAHISDKNVFMDAYMTTADNILEMAAFSTKDSLTGLSNRHGFDSRLVLEWNRAAREKTPLSLLILGVDGDCESSNGHPHNDEVLVATAKTLEHTIKRSTDYIARLSDDKFAALLPVTNADGAMIVAERIRAEIESLSIPCISDNGGKITAFIGASVQTPEHNDQLADFVNSANNALMKAREPGQKTIVFD